MIPLAPGSRCAIARYARHNPWLDLRDLEQEAAVASLEARDRWCPEIGVTTERALAAMREVLSDESALGMLMGGKASVVAREVGLSTRSVRTRTASLVRSMVESMERLPPEKPADTGLGEAWQVAQALSRFVATQRSPVHIPDAKGKAGSADRQRWESAAAAGREPLTVTFASGGERELPALSMLAVERYQSPEDRIDTARAVAEVRRILADQYEAARLVLLAEEKPAEVARKLGVSVRRVYADTLRAMRALRAALRADEAVA